MWKEDIDCIIEERGYHDIEYRLKNGTVLQYIVSAVHYSSKYGKNFIEVYCMIDRPNSYWDWKTFKINSIVSIDGKSYKESISYLKQQEQIEKEKSKKEVQGHRQLDGNPHEAGCAVAGFMGMGFLLAGGLMFNSFGAVAGFVLGNVLGYYIGENCFNNPKIEI